MKKLYRKGTVHPSPPPPIVSEDHLSILPAAIFALAAALSPGDREVLAYLLLCCNSNSNSNTYSSSSSSSSSAYAARKSSPSSSASPPVSGGGGVDHSPRFGCDCFRCYTTYWVRWGSSPNRQLIHDIIEAFEDHQHNHQHHQSKGKAKNGKREKRNNSKNRGGAKDESKRSELETPAAGGESTADLDPVAEGGGEGGEGRDVAAETSPEKGSNVRRFVSFVGERIWGVWG